MDPTDPFTWIYPIVIRDDSDELKDSFTIMERSTKNGDTINSDTFGELNRVNSNMLNG